MINTCWYTCKSGRKEVGRWNERGRAIWLWYKGLGTTKETKQDGGNYTGPSERLSSESEPLSRGIHLLQAIAKEQIIVSHARFLFCSIFPLEQISILHIVPPPWPVLKFRDLVRKWHHNSDDSTDIIFRLILSVLYFSLISSCVIHHLLWHLFFAAQFQGQIICFHYKVWICWCTSVFLSKHLIELSPILSITVGQIVKT